jgi:hypothetical protein
MIFDTNQLEIENLKENDSSILMRDSLYSEEEYESRHNFNRRRSFHEDDIRRQVLDKPIETPKPIKNNNLTSTIKGTYTCTMCNCSSNNNDNFIILSCNHVFHIKCLADEHQYEAKKWQVLDEEFFNNRKCHECSTSIETSEILFIHHKFFKGTKDFITKHDDQIRKLEIQINKLKDEMKISMEYKQKLEFEREKSKQIIAMLNTML